MAMILRCWGCEMDLIQCIMSKGHGSEGAGVDKGEGKRNANHSTSQGV